MPARKIAATLMTSGLVQCSLNAAFVDVRY
jgi:hypothetical protein